MNKSQKVTKNTSLTFKSKMAAGRHLGNFISPQWVFRSTSDPLRFRSTLYGIGFEVGRSNEATSSWPTTNTAVDNNECKLAINAVGLITNLRARMKAMRPNKKPHS